MTHLRQAYNQTFYERQRHLSLSSARVMVPLVMELMPVSSVVDVGCGLGTWLSVFQESGVTDLLGLDGPHVDLQSLLISPQHFRPLDLSCEFALERRFDLAVSLEVAEHLPKASAASFIASITKLAPVVLFSAAAPFQGGTNHLNEQWPGFWAAHFDRNAFVVIDCMRRQVWHRQDVQPCYAQNTLVFVERDRLQSLPRLKDLSNSPEPAQLAMVHPEIFLNAADPARQSFRIALGAACSIGWNNAKRRLQRTLNTGKNEAGER